MKRHLNKIKSLRADFEKLKNQHKSKDKQTTSKFDEIAKEAEESFQEKYRIQVSDESSFLMKAATENYLNYKEEESYVDGNRSFWRSTTAKFINGMERERAESRKREQERDSIFTEKLDIQSDEEEESILDKGNDEDSQIYNRLSVQPQNYRIQVTESLVDSHASISNLDEYKEKSYDSSNDEDN